MSKEQLPAARLLAFGSAPLMQGFRLIGCETYADVDEAELERVLAQLVQSNETAMLYVESTLLHGNGRWLTHCRSEGGRIVICEVPPLTAATEYTPQVETLVANVLGVHALDSSHE